MRDEQSGVEQMVYGALAVHLRSQGHTIIDDNREQKDAPDFLFSKDGLLIACEATQIPLADVYQHVFAKVEATLTKSARISVVWPREPHSWLSQAIEKKRYKIADYKRRSKAGKVWLIVHEPEKRAELFDRDNMETWLEPLLKWGATQVPHGFDRIYFWSKRTGIIRVQRRGERAPRVKFELKDGYPTLLGGYSKVRFRTDEKGAVIEQDLNDMQDIEIIVPPIDPKFQRHKPRYTKQHHKPVKISGSSKQVSIEFDRPVRFGR